MNVERGYPQHPDHVAKQSRKRKTAENGVSTKVAATNPGAPRLPSWSDRDWLWGLILVLAVILVYQPLWRAGFIWDDEPVVTANTCIVGPLGLKEIWTTGAADICPLTLTTFWVEHALWGSAPVPYHLLNVLLHGACAVVLWLVLRSLRVPGAWLGAALWALHPVQVESVAWITEMKNTESGLFFLLSILFFVRWLRAQDLNGRTSGGWNYALSLLFAALAMTSKSSTVILPVVLWLCAWWMEGRWHWRNLARLVPIFLMSIAAGVVSIWTQKLQLPTGTDPQWVRTWPERLVTAGDAIWFYLGKLVWPHPLIAVYPRWVIDAGRWVSYLPVLAVIIVLLILWRNRGTWSRSWLFAFAYFLAALLPALGLVDNYIFQYSLVFDHFQYLASMGPLALVGAGLARWEDFVIPGRSWGQSALCAGLLLVLGMVSWQRAWVYENQETLWTDTLAKNPNCWVGHNNLGLVFFHKGQVDKAIEQYQKALQIYPNYDLAHNNFGAALFHKGEVDGAIEQYQKALELNPNYVAARANLAGVLLSQASRFLEQKQLDAALDKVNSALKIAPKNAEAYGLRGGIYAEKKLWDQAEKDFQTALQIDGKNVQMKFNVAEIEFMQKKYDAARPSFVALGQDSAMGDLATYKVFLCDLFGGHEEVAAKELAAFNQVGANASYYFANAAWLLYHQKTEDARGWLISAANIYAPTKFRIYAASLIDLGYMPLPPPRPTKKQ